MTLYMLDPQLVSSGLTNKFGLTKQYHQCLQVCKCHCHSGTLWTCKAHQAVLLLAMLHLGPLLISLCP